MNVQENLCFQNDFLKTKLGPSKQPKPSVPRILQELQSELFEELLNTINRWLWNSLGILIGSKSWKILSAPSTSFFWFEIHERNENKDD